MRPRIGVSCFMDEKGSSRVAARLGMGYSDALFDVGALPLLLPFTEDVDSLEEMVQFMDGLLLSGGEDVAPHLFGEEPRAGLGEVSPVRDAMEVWLCQRMIDLGKPIFGICRGVQVLNIAFGGTVFQDLAREWHGNLQHMQKAPRDHLAHHVDILSGSRLATIFSEDKIAVNTFHHQAVHRLAVGFVASARSSDGLIEGIEHASQPFVLGVQWHPENLWRKYASHRRLFAAFVEAASLRQ